MLPSMPILFAASLDSIPPADDIASTKENQTSQKESEPLIILPVLNEVQSFSFGSIPEDGRECDDELVLLAENSSGGEKRKIPSQTTPTRKKKLKIEAVEPLPEDRANNDEQANHFATSYLMKVKAELDETTFSKFIALLSDVEESKTNVISLYSEMMKLLANYPDLAEEFIGFLHPHQALEVEKFTNYIQFEHSWNFFRKIDAFHLNKVYHLLQQHMSNPSVTNEAVKNSLLSTFKGHPNISEGLLFLLPNEKPPASCKEDFDDISELGVDDSSKWERLTVPEQAHISCLPGTCDCTCHMCLTNKFCTFCNIKFWNGQIYVKTGKGLRFAKVTFRDCQQEDVLWRLNPAIYSKPVERKRTKSLYNQSKESSHAVEPLCKKSEALVETNKGVDKSKGLDKIQSWKEAACSVRIDKLIDEAAIELVLPLVHNEQVIKKCINEGVILEEMTDIQMCDVLKTAMETEQVTIISNLNQEDDTSSEVSNKEVEDIAIESEDVNEMIIEKELSTMEENYDPKDKEDFEETENKNIFNKSEEGTEVVSETKSKVWTREEDKLILQAFQKQLGSEQTFSTISDLLPTRTVDDIQGRFQVLMNLLEQMTCGSSHPS